MEEERLGEEAAKRLYDDQQAELARMNEARLRQEELEAARAAQAADASLTHPVSADKSTEVHSADASLSPTEAAHHDSSTAVDESDISEDESPSPPHSAIYIPGRRTKRKATRRGYSADIDLDAEDSSFLQEGSIEDFPEGSFNVLVKWEVTDGQINTIHQIDKSYMQFTFLQEILHLVDKQDLITLYGLVTKYYSTRIAEGVGLYLLGYFKCYLILILPLVLVFMFGRIIISGKSVAGSSILFHMFMCWKEQAKGILMHSKMS